MNKLEINKLIAAGIDVRNGKINEKDFKKAVAALEDVIYSKQLDDTEEGYEVLFEALPEEERPDGNFSEESDVEWVKKQLDEGNEAAWFTARVTVTDPETNEVGIDYLGACSYKSFDDFLSKDSMYLEDMIEVAKKELEGKIKTVATASTEDADLPEQTLEEVEAAIKITEEDIQRCKDRIKNNSEMGYRYMGISKERYSDTQRSNREYLAGRKEDLRSLLAKKKELSKKQKA